MSSNLWSDKFGEFVTLNPCVADYGFYVAWLSRYSLISSV